MKSLSKRISHQLWTRASLEHIEKKLSPLVLLLGKFVCCVVLVRLVKTNLKTRVNHDHEMKMILEPVINDGVTVEDTQKIAELISKIIKIPVTPELEGIKLNHVYGSMGKEQHLPRYPGDRLDLNNWFLGEGMTPAVGAFGYFVNNKSELNSEIIKMEKYYIAVQTLYLPEWNSKWAELKPWFAFRKMLVINPANGKMLVAVIADAGPALWTGKQFGGSPEVYHELNLKDNQSEVMVFFVKDEGGISISPGPIVY